MQDSSSGILDSAASNAENAIQDAESISAAPVAGKAFTSFTPTRWGATESPGPAEWLIGQLIQLGVPNTIGGDAGVGKTRMVAHIAVCVASGEPFLGFPVKQTPVLYLNFDDQEALPRQWVERAARGLGYDVLDDLPLYYLDADKVDRGIEFTKGLLNKDVFNFILSFAEWIKDVEGVYPAIMLDTFAAAFPTVNANDANAVLAAYEQLRKLRVACGNTTMIILEHTPKPFAGESADRGVSGSIQKKAKVRTQHILSAVDSDATNGQDIIRWKVDKCNAALVLKPFTICRKYDAVSDADFIATTSLPANTGVPKADKVLQFLLEVLQDAAGTPITQKVLEEKVLQHLSVSDRTVAKAFSRLKEEPQVQEINLSGRGSPKTYSWVSSGIATINMENPHEDSFDAVSTSSREIPSRTEQLEFNANITVVPETLDSATAWSDEPQALLI